MAQATDEASAAVFFFRLSRQAGGISDVADIASITPVSVGLPDGRMLRMISAAQSESGRSFR